MNIGGGADLVTQGPFFPTFNPEFPIGILQSAIWKMIFFADVMFQLVLYSGNHQVHGAQKLLFGSPNTPQ